MSQRLALALLLLAAGLKADTRVLYDFEGSTQGWTGKTAVSNALGVTSGKSSLEIDATGSRGWNQDLAVQSSNADWTEAVELLVDVTLPPGTKEKAGFVQLIPVFSGPVDNWYQSGKVELEDGLNKVKVKLSGHKVTTPWKFHLVFNSANPIPGKIYVDNLRMRKPGKPGTLRVKVLDQAGQPVAGAVVAAGTLAVRTGADGLAVLKAPGDPYPAEVLGVGLAPANFTANIPSGGSAEQTVSVRRLPPAAPVQTRAWVMAERPGVVFDAHRIYGHNQAMWNGPDPFTNPDHIQKLKAIRSYMIRIPGGGYANHWDWRTGNVIKLDGSGAVDWTPEANWATWKRFFALMGPQAEALMIINLFYRTPQDSVDWIADARKAGIKVRYVELGNEPDLDPHIVAFGEKGYFTKVENYVKQAAAHARAIRQAFPDIKLIGPCIAQFHHRECPGQPPWECDKYREDGGGVDFDAEGNEPWMKKFLRLFSQEGDLLDGIAFHTYPYWPGTPAVWDPAKAFATTALPSKFLPQWRQWLKQYYPAKADRMEIAMTEYHLQVPETYITADLEAAVWHANFLGEYIKAGGNIASAWDMNTMKAGDGGGHGMLDISGDPTRPYAERAKYWVFKMLANNFTGTLVPAQSNSPDVAVYAAKDSAMGSNRTTVLLVNRSPDKPAQVTVQVSGVAQAKQMRQIKLTRAEYLWSRVLVRAVVNEDPTAKQQVFGAPQDRQGWRIFSPTVEPMSVALYVLE